jgi:hypothetical protein
MLLLLEGQTGETWKPTNKIDVLLEIGAYQERKLVALNFSELKEL